MPKVSDSKTYNTRHKDLIRRDAAWHMAKGAAIGAAVFFGPILAIYVLYLVGLLLPVESREVPDPTPDSFSSVLSSVHTT